jgi:hypothetical protein
MLDLIAFLIRQSAGHTWRTVADTRLFTASAELRGKTFPFGTSRASNSELLILFSHAVACRRSRSSAAVALLPEDR